MRHPLDFPGKARYIGSLPRGGSLCDFYEVEIEGAIRYIYIPADSPRDSND